METPRPPLLIAHRGASFDAPENTVAAFELGWEQGADGAETDIRLTRDGAVVCLHDATAKRTAGRDLAAAATTLDELRALDAGAWKGEPWRGQRIPTLDELLATVPRGRRVLIEVKCGPEVLPAMDAAIARSRLAEEQVAVISFHAEVIAESKRRTPHRRALWLTTLKPDPLTGSPVPAVQAILDTIAATGADGVDCQAHALLDEAFVRALRAAGREVHAWTVDDPAAARRLASLGVDSITTNRPGWLRRELGAAAVGR